MSHLIATMRDALGPTADEVMNQNERETMKREVKRDKLRKEKTSLLDRFRLKTQSKPTQGVEQTLDDVIESPVVPTRKLVYLRPEERNAIECRSKYRGTKQ